MSEGGGGERVSDNTPRSNHPLPTPETTQDADQSQNVQRISSGLNKATPWTRLREDDLKVKKIIQLKDGASSSRGKATATIHASSEQVLAFLWFYCSNLKMKEHQVSESHSVSACLDENENTSHY